MISFYAPDLMLVLPELILTMSALWLLIGGVFYPKRDASGGFQLYVHLAIFILLLALGVLIFQYSPGLSWVTFEGQICQDDLIFFAKFLILLGSAAVLGIMAPSMIHEEMIFIEFPSLILLATLGMILMVEANDFLILFIGLEMQGLCLYILASLKRTQITSSEAAIKYFVLGAVSTCLYLYGTSLIYGFSGSTHFESLDAVIRMESADGLPLGLFLGLIFIVAALAFKVSAAPFHMWTPDVYQGCPTPITAFIAATPKVAAMIIFLRLMLQPFMLLYGEWQFLIVALSFVSMAWGALAALKQTHLNRLLAYSAIGQMGYALMGVAAGNEEGVQAVFVYLTIYLVMIIGTFGCLLSLKGKAATPIQHIEDLSGISAYHPKVALALAIFMFSLAGIPPLAGFFGKLYVFRAALSVGLFGLATLGVLSSVVAAYYYLKIVKVMYFDPIPEVLSDSYGQTLVISSTMKIVLILSTGLILLFFLLPNAVFEMAQRASTIIPT